MSDTSTRALFAIVALVLLLPACKVGPNYRSPTVATPASWVGTSDESIGAGVTSRPVASAADVAAWWTQFNDPTLTSLMERAMRGNLSLAQAWTRVCQARAAQAIVASGLQPDVNASAAIARAHAGGFSNDLFRAGFDASWEIDVFGGIRRGIEAADADVRSAQFDREAVLVSLMGEIGAGYLDMRGAQRQLAIARQNLAAQQQTLELTKERFDAGFVSALDVANARAQVATTGSQIPSFESQVQSSIYALSVLVGEEPGALLNELSPEAPFPATPSRVPVGLPSEILQRRPDIRRAESDLHAATARIGVAIADQYPKFSLTGSFGTAGAHAGSLADLANRFWAIGPSFTVPVFTGGRTQASIALARATTCGALLAYKASVLTALQDVETALISFTREQERQVFLAESVSANRQAVDLSLQQYSAGKTDFLNALQAQRSLYLTEAALAQSETTVAIDLVALYKALGGGWSQAPACP